MVQLGVTDNQKENLDKKPIGEAPSTVVVLQTALPRAKSSCCTKRVKVAVTVVCFLGTLAILGCLLRFALIRYGWCGTVSRIDDDGLREPFRSDGVWEGDRDGDRHGDHHDDRTTDGRHGDRDQDSREHGHGHSGDRDGDHDGDRHGDRDGDRTGDHDGGDRDGDRHGDRDGDRTGDHDGGDRDGDHHDGPPPPPRPSH